MVVVYTLLETIALAKEGLNGNEAVKKFASEVAHKKVMPWTPQLCGQDFLVRNYYTGRTSLDGLVFQVQESGREFIFDNLSRIFIQHGGMEFINNEHADALYPVHYPNSDTQFSSCYKRVLHTQHSEGLTGIVIGKVPPWMKVHGYHSPGAIPSKERTGPIYNSVYLYIEADNASMPGFVGPIDGNVQMSMPILYFTTPFDEGAPIRERGLKSRVVILLPNEFYERIGPSTPIIRRGTPS